MLGSLNVHAVLAVKDVAAAKTFYENTLGLTKISEDPAGGVMYQSGSTKLLIYPSQSAGSNQATAASWETDDVDGAAKDLQAKGVAFEHYDLPGVTLEGDVHVMGSNRGVWFKDPDGNVLCVSNGM